MIKASRIYRCRERPDSSLGPFRYKVAHGDPHACSFPTLIFPGSASCIWTERFLLHKQVSQGPGRFRTIFQFTQLMSGREKGPDLWPCLPPKGLPLISFCPSPEVTPEVKKVELHPPRVLCFLQSVLKALHSCMFG